VTQGFNGTNNAGLTTAGLYPITAKQDTFWVQNATVGQIRLSGLNPASAYNLTFFASRSTGGTNRVTKYAVGAVTTTLDATDNVSTTATLNAVIPNASGQIDISISNNINSGYGYIGVLDLQEVPPLSALQTWKNTQFGANASIPAIAGDTADPDADGIVNLMEYALGGLPNTASTVILPVLSAPTDRLQITFTRLAPTDVTYLVQSSTDLIAWTTIATFSANGATWTGAATVNETGSGATRNVIVPDTTVLNAGSKRFLRLKITTP
jgi:hypothetical protein